MTPGGTTGSGSHAALGREKEEAEAEEEEAA